MEQTAAKYLAAVKEAGRIYRKIEERKGKGTFIPEVSMDGSEQSPQICKTELLIILAAIADEGIPIQTPSRPSLPAALTRAWTIKATW